MDTKQLEDNFAAVINDINLAKPSRPGPFITRWYYEFERKSTFSIITLLYNSIHYLTYRVRLVSPPSPEMFKVEFEQYLPKDSAVDEEEEEGERPDAVIASH